MVYPFVPPNLPLTVATFPSASVVSTPSTPAVGEQVKQTKSEDSQPTQTKSPQLNRAIAVKKEKVENPPERFPPEFTPDPGVNSAKSLGSGLAVGFPLLPTQVSATQTTSVQPRPTQIISSQSTKQSINRSGDSQFIPVVSQNLVNQNLTNQNLVNNNLDNHNLIHKNQTNQNTGNNQPSRNQKLNPRTPNTDTGSTTPQNNSFNEPVALKFPAKSPQSNPNSQQSSQLGKSSPNTPGQPLRIKFSTKVNNENPRPSTIEFKSRSEVEGTPSTIDFSPNSNSNSTNKNPSNTPTENQTPSPNPNTNPNTTTPTTPADPEARRIIEVIADRQEYDEQRRVVTAEGRVNVRFDGALMVADRVQVNLDNLIAVGDGNVALTRGEQLLQGARFVYNFIQDSGEIQRGSGEIFIPSAGTDLSFTPSVAGGVPRQSLSDRLLQQQRLTGVSSPGGIDINLGGRADATNINPPREGGQVRRVRFEAAKIDFFPRGWQAEDVRLTNDPFSPPELEVRANRVTLTRVSPLEDRVRTQGQRLVFDQGFSLPIPRNEQVIDRRERDATPAIVSPGFDGEDRGGLFFERQFNPINTATTQLSVTPQFFAQRAIGDNDGLASLFGLKSQLRAVFSPRSRVDGRAVFDTLELDDLENNLRANLRFQQAIGEQNRPHVFNLDFNYRDRLYNGTLGFQRVQSSFGGVILSPLIPLGRSGLNLTYQAGAQYINARTDRLDLLEPIRDDDLISLGRFQGNAKIFGAIPIWRGKQLTATPTTGVKYTPNPLLPYLNAFGEINGTTTFYTSGDSQNTLIGTIGLDGQIGNFSKPFLDYTGFRLSYSQGLRDGTSPFLFDRAVDTRLLNFGIVQQIYGPFRLGFQTSINLDNGRSSSTEYSLEYSRRSYGIILRYNPVLELGGISFRISDFNWTGGTDPFSGGDFTPVVGGVEQR